jgi:hypothetical protein
MVRRSRVYDVLLTATPYDILDDGVVVSVRARNSRKACWKAEASQARRTGRPWVTVKVWVR